VADIYSTSKTNIERKKYSLRPEKVFSELITFFFWVGRSMFLEGNGIICQLDSDVKWPSSPHCSRAFKLVYNCPGKWPRARARQPPGFLSWPLGKFHELSWCGRAANSWFMHACFAMPSAGLLGDDGECESTSIACKRSRASRLAPIEAGRR
jgi:hypothetical protein